MENSENDSEAYRNSFIGSNSNSRRFSVQLSASNIIQAPLSMLLEFSGIFRTRSSPQDTENLVETVGNTSIGSDNSGSSGEVSIRIISPGEQEGLSETSLTRLNGNLDETLSDQIIRSDFRQVGTVPILTTSASNTPDSGNENVDGEPENGMGGSNRDSSYQRYDIQHATRWIEQILPFSLLLLVVFIRQHLQGFFVTFWISVVMLKSNDILKKQTALKSDRNCFLLVGITVFFILHVFGIYWWYRNDDLLPPLALLPPTKIPPFWHAIFVIMVNDMLVRQTAMIFKCMLLVYYKNNRGHKFRKQGQILTLVEYFLLFYRALLPAPVWYRFFLNKEYGSLFSSLTTGLYLTFKLTSIVEKVRAFFTALKALSRKEVHYGSYATKEQVHAAGDVCAICQESIHAPILLRCKHIFCEDCVSEWFERERTCPLCRALVKPADLKSFSDGSTSLFFQLF